MPTVKGTNSAVRCQTRILTHVRCNTFRIHLLPRTSSSHTMEIIFALFCMSHKTVVSGMNLLRQSIFVLELLYCCVPHPVIFSTEGTCLTMQSIPTSNYHTCVIKIPSTMVFPELRKYIVKGNTFS